MSAEVLREAAREMRERANRADGTTWLIGRGTCEIARPRGNWEGGTRFVASTYGGVGAEEANAEHIASWHPAVALAVADWLEATAAENDSPEGTHLAALNFVGADALAALAVARAYLGSAS